MLRMEQLGDWLVVEKLFWQVTDSIHGFLLSVERLSITFTSNNSLPFHYDLNVKKLLYSTFYGGRKQTTTETYTSHLFRCDKKIRIHYNREVYAAPGVVDAKAP